MYQSHLPYAKPQGGRGSQSKYQSHIGLPLEKEGGRVIFCRKKIFEQKEGIKYAENFLKLKNYFSEDEFPEIIIEVEDEKKKDACKKALEKFLIKDVIPLISERVMGQKISTPLLDCSTAERIKPDFIFRNHVILGYFSFFDYESPTNKGKCYDSEMYYYEFEDPQFYGMRGSFPSTPILAEEFLAKRFFPVTKIYDNGKTLVTGCSVIRNFEKKREGEYWVYYKKDTLPQDTLEL